jgi:hypothetical protein
MHSNPWVIRPSATRREFVVEAIYKCTRFAQQTNQVLIHSYTLLYRTYIPLMKRKTETSVHLCRKESQSKSNLIASPLSFAPATPGPCLLLRDASASSTLPCLLLLRAPDPPRSPLPLHVPTLSATFPLPPPHLPLGTAVPYKSA